MASRIGLKIDIFQYTIQNNLLYANYFLKYLYIVGNYTNYHYFNNSDINLLFHVYNFILHLNSVQKNWHFTVLL